MISKIRISKLSENQIYPYMVLIIPPVVSWASNSVNTLGFNISSSSTNLGPVLLITEPMMAKNSRINTNICTHQRLLFDASCSFICSLIKSEDWIDFGLRSFPKVSVVFRRLAYFAKNSNLAQFYDAGRQKQYKTKWKFISLFNEKSFHGQILFGKLSLIRNTSMQSFV